MTWHMKKVTGGAEHILRIKVALSQDNKPSGSKTIGPISLNFTIPMYTVSRLAVRYMQILNKPKGYNPYRWVRYISSSSSYVCRV